MVGCEPAPERREGDGEVSKSMVRYYEAWMGDDGADRAEGES